MDRLTMWDEEEKRWRMKPGYLMSQQVIKRLAAYEDTGLTPEEVETAIEALRRLKDLKGGNNEAD